MDKNSFVGVDKVVPTLSYIMQVDVFKVTHLIPPTPRKCSPHKKQFTAPLNFIVLQSSFENAHNQSGTT